MQSRTASLFLGLATYLCSVDAGRIHYIAQSPKGSARLEGEAAVTGAPAPSTPALSNLLLKGNPWWAGKSVADARKALAEKQMSGANLAGTGVTDTEDLDLLSDDELYKVFAAGVPDVPGRLPGEENQFLMCNGDAYINTFTNNSWPRGPWPNGDEQPQVALNERLWKGKVIYTNPKTNVTQLWNLMWSNSTVEATGVIFPVKEGYSPDKKPSVIVDYKATEALWDRALKDEMRRVGPSIWLGVAWVVDPVNNQNPDHAGALQPVIDALKPLENATYKGVLEAIGVQGPNSSPETSGLTMPEPGQPIRLTYFAIDCRPNATPKLQYTSTSQFFHLLAELGGYMPVGTPMPDLNEAAGSEAVENWSKEFPNSSDGDDASPIVLWPFKLSELGPIGYIKLPALPLEPIFGEVWRYDFRKEIARLGLSLPPFLAPAPAPK